MTSRCVLSLRPSVIAMLTLGGMLTVPAPVAAQGFGVGGRFAWVNPDTEADVDTARYYGGQNPPHWRTPWLRAVDRQAF